MNCKAFFASAAVIALCAVAGAQELSPAQKRLEEAKQQLQAAGEQLKVAQERRDALERAVAEAENAAVRETVERARAGDEAALGHILGNLGSGSVVDYAWAKPFKGPGINHAKVVGLIREQLQAAAPVQRSKLCWLLGENGSDLAAAALRNVLAGEKDPNVIGNAIAALGRCANSPANLDAVRPFLKDDRRLAMQIGYYSRGSLRLEAKDSGGQPLRLLAQAYLQRRSGEAVATVPGEVIVETPSLFAAGFQWHIQGDANYNCAVSVAYRKAGAPAWKSGFPLWRCRSWEPGLNSAYTFNVGNLLAGSLFNLEPGTTYEVRLTLADPDGGAAERLVKVTTRTEPPVHEGLRTLYVVPADPAAAGPGTGTKEDPFRGIAAADKAARPGDVFLLQPGKYVGNVSLTQGGEPGKPIVWRGADREKVILDGTGKDECLGFSGRDHLQFENLSFVGATQGCIKTSGCHNIVVRRCTFSRFGMAGILGFGRVPRTRSGRVEEGRNCMNWFVTDNIITGPKDWRKDRGSRSSWGVAVSGPGHVIAWNRIDDCWDCISLASSYNTEPRTGSLDICYNDLRQGSDDGVEADYVFHNVRVYRNRLTNTFSSLSFQPVYGGPGYLLYNAMHNTGNKPFKLHVNTTGMIICHNTCTSSREAFDGSSAHDVVLMNNLLLGLRGEEGYWMNTQADPLTMDYTGYTVASPTPLIKHNNVRYATMADFAEDTGQMKHAVRVDWDVFAQDARPEGYHVTAKPNPLLLRAGSPAVDAGVVLPGINDGFQGAAPDLGCYELGQPVPHYGPR